MDKIKKGLSYKYIYDEKDGLFLFNIMRNHSDEARYRKLENIKYAGFFTFKNSDFANDVVFYDYSMTLKKSSPNCKSEDCIMMIELFNNENYVFEE